MTAPAPPRIEVRGLALAVHGEIVQQDLDFEVRPGSIFAITGRRGSGKSLLLQSMVGLERPAKGEILYDGESLWGAPAASRARIRARLGVFFQGAVLLPGMTLLENVAAKLRLQTALGRAEADDLARFKLDVMGLQGYGGHYPSQVSDDVRVRASLARAIALDPDVLFFDEPSAGLDPLGSLQVDDIVLALREATGATVVLATHDLPSLHAIADDAVFLDAERKTMIARGRPTDLRDRCEDPEVRAFLTRGRP